MKEIFDPGKLVRANIKAMKPYSSARDEFHGSAGVFLDANENPYGRLNRYPDPYQWKLKEQISKLKGVPVENIFLGNGSDEIIDLSFRIFCNPGNDKALTFSPTYGMYEVSAEANDIKIIKIPLNDQFQIRFNDIKPYLSDTSIKLIFICSPNNPTGNCIKRDVIERIINDFAGIVVIDEAYNDFSDEPSFRNQISEFPNLIVMQTFSKAFGMASVRVGMAFANKEIVRYYNKLKPPYNISSINQAAVSKNIENGDRYKTQVERIKSERKRINEELLKIPAVLKVFPSDSNFLLVRVNDPDTLYNMLVERSIIVRNRNSIVNGCLRITIGSKRENTKLLNALKKINL